MRPTTLAYLFSALAGCSAAAESPVTPEAARPEPPSAADSNHEIRSPIRRASDVRSFEATGRLLTPPQASAELTLPLQATITALHAAPGDRVEAGQVLAHLVVPEAARAFGQLEGAELRAAAHAARLEQLEALRGEGLARGAELADARARLAEAKAAEHEARALLDTLASAGLYRRSRSHELRAPVAGVVTALNATLGSTRGPSDGPVYAIAAGQPRRIEARFAFELPRGAHFELWARERRVASLRLVNEAPQIDPGDATRIAWFDASEPVDLPHGSTVRVRVRLPEDSWVIPRKALRPGSPPTVHTQRTGALPVELLATLGSEALVRGALRPEDLVREAEAP